MAGMAGFEPTNARVKVWCLTAWRHPYIYIKSTPVDLIPLVAEAGFEPTTFGL